MFSMTDGALPPASARGGSATDQLNALQDQIRDAGPSLGRLDGPRCAAQIAVWAGRARALQQTLTPPDAATRRAAFRIFFERLSRLCVAMEADFVDALSPFWSAADWETYVAMNQAVIDGREPAVSLDQQRLYHQARLRSLRLPQRRRARHQAQAILLAAARVLPEDDPDLAATRRDLSPPAGPRRGLRFDAPPERGVAEDEFAASWRT